MPTKKSASRRTTSRTAGPRERIAPRGDTRFVRRDSTGKFNESDDAGRSLAADRRTKSKTTVKSGYGDKGDRKTRGR